jgi:hypothetical protein
VNFKQLILSFLIIKSQQKQIEKLLAKIEKMKAKKK